MSVTKVRSLGILELERGIPPETVQPSQSPNSIRNPSTFSFPTMFETVSGAWVDNVVPGDRRMEKPYIEAARRLVERGASVISSNCGFSVRYQAAVAGAVNVPVIMSSLLLAPSILLQLPAAAKIAVVTYDSRHCGNDIFEVLGINRATREARFVVGGIEGGEFWRNSIEKPVVRTSLKSIQEDVAACAERLRTAYPEIKCVLLECAEFPITASVIRDRTALPVYDLVSLCKTTMAALANRDGLDVGPH